MAYPVQAFPDRPHMQPMLGLLLGLTVSLVAAAESFPSASTGPETESAASPRTPSATAPGEASAHSAPVDLPDDARSRALIARVGERRDAIAARDFDAVYLFEAPSERGTKDAATFKSGFGSFVEWKDFTVRSIAYTDDDTADVTVSLSVVFYNPFDDKGRVATPSVAEQWVYEQDQWWHKTITRRTPLDAPLARSPGELADDTGPQDQDLGSGEQAPDTTQ